MRGVLCLMAVLLAGCCVTPFSPHEVPVGAPSEGGTGPRQITVQVLAPDEPADGIPVFLFWEDPVPPSGTNRTALYLLGLRSEGGIVVGHVPTDVTLWAAVGGEGQWTQEWIPSVATPGTAPAEAVLRVYPRAVNGTATGTWTPGTASVYQDTGSGSISWQPHDLLPGNTTESRQGFAKRLSTVRMSVNWTNGLTQQADLALAAYHTDAANTRCLYLDANDQFGDQGPQTEWFDSRMSDDEFSCADFDGTPAGEFVLMAGPATGRPAAMPLGLPYEFSYRLEFGAPSDIEELCRQLANEYTLRFLDPATGEVYREEDRGGINREPFGPIPGPAALLVVLLLLGLAGALRTKLVRHR